MVGLLFCAGTLEAEIRCQIKRSVKVGYRYESIIYVLTLKNKLIITAKKILKGKKAACFEISVAKKRNNIFNQKIMTKNLNSFVVYKHLKKLCNNDAKVEIAPDWLQALCLKNGLSEK